MKRKFKAAEMKTVLFVDYDEIVLHSLERDLMDESYNKLFANSCKEALEILQREQVHVIVTEMSLPEMSGLELLRVARKEHPDIVGIVLSGYEHDAALQRAVDRGEIFKLVPKPWKLGVVDFEFIIRQAVDHSHLQTIHG